MFEKVVADLAAEMGVRLSRIMLEEIVDCRDAFLLQISKGSHHVYTLIFQTDLDNLKTGDCNTNIFLKISSALTRLKLRSL